MCKIDVKYIYNIAKFYKSNTLPVGPICRCKHKNRWKKIQEERKERVSIITVLNACENI